MSLYTNIDMCRDVGDSLEHVWMNESGDVECVREYE